MPVSKQNIDPNILTVSALNQLAARTLHAHIDTVWVQGEISNLSRAASGHCYFTLKDANAQIRCAFFKTRRQHTHNTLQNGDEVVAMGKLGIYQMRGDYQLLVDALEAFGEGALRRAFEKLKKSLSHLFNPEHKQNIPQLPTCLGIITSPDAAALHDILSVTGRRWPNLPLMIYPSLVQGKQAAQAIANAIALANERNEVEVLIIARGGGSLEDLWAFNEPAVAEAIYQSRIPIVTGIGHENDTTIADMVADLRAPTPSAAAEHCTPLVSDFQHRVDQAFARLKQAMQHTINHLNATTKVHASRLSHPNHTLQEKSQRLDYLSLQLCNLIKQSLQNILSQWRNNQERLYATAQLIPTKSQHQKLEQCFTVLCKAMTQQMRDTKQAIARCASNLDHLSPLGTLARGYSIVYDSQHGIVKDAGQIGIGDALTVQCHNGQLSCDVTGTTQRSIKQATVAHHE